jgi:VIT1/CCC1 family predicted Fe2+/Mn2+ transporter
MAARGRLGANHGILSTSGLVLGDAAARGNHSSVLVAGIAGPVAGAGLEWSKRHPSSDSVVRA